DAGEDHHRLKPDHLEEGAEVQGGSASKARSRWPAVGRCQPRADACRRMTAPMPAMVINSAAKSSTVLPCR
ncbi:MAG: hypothetical protein ACP5TV_13810, partial [Anaerolineae bacterium]